MLSVLHKNGSTVLDGATYTYDNAGNRQTKLNKLNSVTEGYTYDPLYQLTQVVQGSTTTESYSYDFVGNRLSSVGVPLYSYNTSNELTSNSTGSYTYDNNGSTLTDPSGKSYTWDFENRLTQVVVPGTGTVSFKYDPFGRRIQKSGPLGTTNYLYDGDNLLEELDGSGNFLAKYLETTKIDEQLSELRTGVASYYQADGLGSVSSLSAATGTLTNTYKYDSFGKLTGSTGTTANPFQFTSRESDSETGLRFYRARYYDPTLGRFLSEDPLGFDGSVNFYNYVQNGPVNWTDPLGLVRCTYDIASHTLSCVSNDGSQNFESSSVRSGNNNDGFACRNNPTCANVSNHGPIPPHKYTLGPLGGTPKPHPVPRVPIYSVGPRPFDRDSFQVHQGGPNSSNGCIVLDPPEYRRFMDFYRRDNRGNLEVQ